MDNLILDKKIEPNLGDYVVVIAKEKLRSLQYVARFDDYDDENDDYEGMFLQNINSGAFLMDHCSLLMNMMPLLLLQTILF